MKCISPKTSEEQLSRVSAVNIFFYNFTNHRDWSNTSQNVQQLKADILWLQDQLSQEIGKLEDTQKTRKRFESSLTEL